MARPSSHQLRRQQPARRQLQSLGTRVAVVQLMVVRTLTTSAAAFTTESRDRLKAELYLDRERAGQLSDLTV